MRDERDFIRRLGRVGARAVHDLLVGIGDDAAVVRVSSEKVLVAAVDALVEDVHFRRRYFPPDAVGHKALAVNLSDLAAMGATPRFCLLTLALPAGCAVDFADRLVDGLLSLADRFGVALIGGDTSSSPERMFVDVMVLGEAAPGRTALRSGARVGDAIFVSGELGNAAAGLRYLEDGHATGALVPSAAIQAAIDSLLRPIPRVELGRSLVERSLVTAMMDVSDGLSIDLSRMCEASGVGAVLDADAIPLATGAKVIALRNRQDPFDLALHGGEDYELLFTAPPELRAEIEALATPDVPMTRIGEIRPAREGVRLVRDGKSKSLAARGFDHFREACK